MVKEMVLAAKLAEKIMQNPEIAYSLGLKIKDKKVKKRKGDNNR